MGRQSTTVLHLLNGRGAILWKFFRPIALFFLLLVKIFLGKWGRRRYGMWGVGGCCGKREYNRDINFSLRCSLVPV